MNPKYISQKFNRISQKLFMAYMESHIPLSNSFICFICFGILIDPKKCSKCKVGCCENCLLEIVPNEKIFCKCYEKMKKENFIHDHVFNLERTFYLIYEDKNFVISKEYQYKEAIEKFYTLQNAPSGYLRYVQESKILHLEDHPWINKKERENKKTILHIMNEGENSFNSKNRIASKKIAKLINFNYSKGYKYNQPQMNERIIARKEILKVNKWHINLIDLRNANYSRNVVIALAMLIRDDREYLKSFYLGTIENASYIIFQKAISFCLKLQTLKIGHKNVFFYF